MATKKEDKEIKKETINVEKIKNEIVEYAIENVNSKIDDLVKKTDRRIISQKNRSIIKRNIIIIILICLSVFLTYLLYNDGYFDKYFNHNFNITEIINVENKDEVDVEDNEKLDELIKKYSYLLNNIIISENSDYLEDYYNGKLSNELKLSIALTNLDSDKYIKDEDIYIINPNELNNEYSKLFLIDNYKNTSFYLNGIGVKYLKVSDIYFTNEIPNIKNNIKREITNVEVNDDYIIISTIEGLIKNNNLLNIISKNIVKESIEDKSLKNFINELNVLKYTFEKEEGNYILIKIDK